MFTVSMWWVLAIALVMIELLSWTTHAFWLALVAACTGILVGLIPAFHNPLWQMGAFAAASAGLLYALHTVQRPPLEPDPGAPPLNDKRAQYIGMRYPLTEPLSQGQGAIQIGDTRWRVIGPDHVPVGTWVEVVGFEGLSLRVCAIPPEKAAELP